MTIMHVMDQTFEAEVLNAEKPVLVDFWAEWCGPCRMLLPILEELDKELNTTLKIVKVNIDESPNTPTRYAVQSIPTLALFKNGKLVDTKIGMSPKPSLQNWISKNLS